MFRLEDSGKRTCSPFLTEDLGANDIILKVNRGRAALKMPPLMRRDQL